MPDSRREPEESELLRRAAAGDLDARAELLGRHRERLLRMIAVRMDRRLRTRVDENDVLQEAMLVAYRRFDEFARAPEVSLYTWMRALTKQCLVDLHRKHLTAQRRSVSREQSEGASGPIAARLAGSQTSPSQHAARQEKIRRVNEVLGKLSPQDREIVVMRHFEQLSTREVSEILGISESAAKVRLMRALQHFCDAADGELDGLV